MPFTDEQEAIIGKTREILKRNERVIKDEFTRFDVVYIGGIDPKQVRFEIQPTFPAMSKILNFDLQRFYHDPYYNFQKTFEYRIWHYENVPDDMPFIGIYEMGYAIHSLELSMLGILPRWMPGNYPKDGQPIIRDASDLEALVVPDFSSAGFMPKVIQEYRNLKEDLKGRLEVGIKKFVQGPFQLATSLAGREKVYESLKTDVLFVKKLMDFQIAFHHEWINGWEQLHGREYGMVNIGEETLDTATKINPEVFQEIILPYHIRYGDEFKKVHWHSCADVNAILDQLIKIPNLTVVEIGPYTDTLTTVKHFVGTGVRFYKIPHPITEVLNPSPGVQESILEDVLRAAEFCPIKILVETPDMEPAIKMLEKFRKLTA